MKLYLVQHGEAMSEAEDERRPLTERGSIQVTQVAGEAKGLGVSPARVLHSGKLRAEQTAEVMRQTLDLPGKPEAVEGLGPNDDVRPWVEKVNGESEDLMIVGHLPFLESLASLLLKGDESVRTVQFRYAALACLERRADGSWHLTKFLAPPA